MQKLSSPLLIQIYNALIFLLKEPCFDYFVEEQDDENINDDRLLVLLINVKKLYSYKISIKLTDCTGLSNK